MWIHTTCYIQHVFVVVAVLANYANYANYEILHMLQCGWVPANSLRSLSLSLSQVRNNANERMRREAQKQPGLAVLVNSLEAKRFS